MVCRRREYSGRAGRLSIEVYPEDRELLREYRSSPSWTDACSVSPALSICREGLEAKVRSSGPDCQREPDEELYLRGFPTCSI